MNQQKVFITGSGIISSLGNDIETVFKNLIDGKSGVRTMDDWRDYNGLNSFLMAPAYDFDSSIIPRKKRRSMSRMAEMGALATFAALEQAGIRGENPWTDIDTNRAIMIMGSTTGSPKTLEDHFKKLFEKGGPESQTSTAFFKIMNHSVPAKVAMAVDYRGPLLSTGSPLSVVLMKLFTQAPPFLIPYKRPRLIITIARMIHPAPSIPTVTVWSFQRVLELWSLSQKNICKREAPKP